MHTTLVLCSWPTSFLDRCKQFCSDLVTKISAAAPFQSGATQAGAQQKTKIWLNNEETPCHGKSFLADNLLLLLRSHPQR
jgi:hypothetical protein